MQNTFNTSSDLGWLTQQEAFKTSLQLQPLVVVLRPHVEDFDLSNSKQSLFTLIEELAREGVNHIEIAWSSHPRWMPLMQELGSSFSEISLGAASITSQVALESVAELGLDYAMTPTWNPTLQLYARDLKQLLIPGVFSPTEIQQAKSFGYQLIKLFPASTLGIKYIQSLKGPIENMPFIIAAGGLTVKDLNPWLKAGYGAITLGRKLIKEQTVDPELKKWLQVTPSTT